MSIDSGAEELKALPKLFDPDCDNPEFKASLNAYNNKRSIKHDIQSRKFLIVRRLLREGKIDVLNTDNQSLMADFIDYALEKIPQEKKRRGRPQNDEINNIKLMKNMYREYNKLRFVGFTINEALFKLSKRTVASGKHIGIKSIEQHVTNYSANPRYYENRLYNLFYYDGHDLWSKYMVLVGNNDYIDSLSSLSDGKVRYLDDPGPWIAEKDLHEKAIRELSLGSGLSESDVEERIMWQEDWDDTEEDIAALRERIDNIKRLPLKTIGMTAAEIGLFIGRVETQQIGAEFMYSMQEAKLAKAEVVSKLKEIYAEAVGREAEVTGYNPLYLK